MTVSTKLSLLNRVVVGVDLTLVSQPFQSYEWETGQPTTTTAAELYGEVTILRAAGRALSWGQGGASGLAVCDGTTVNRLHVDVTPGGGPFKKGSAVVGAWMSAADIATFQDSDGAELGRTSGPDRLSDGGRGGRRRVCGGAHRVPAAARVSFHR